MKLWLASQVVKLTKHVLPTSNGFFGNFYSNILCHKKPTNEIFVKKIWSKQLCWFSTFFSPNNFAPRYFLASKDLDLELFPLNIFFLLLIIIQKTISDAKWFFWDPKKLKVLDHLINFVGRKKEEMFLKEFFSASTT